VAAAILGSLSLAAAGAAAAQDTSLCVSAPGGAAVAAKAATAFGATLTPAQKKLLQRPYDRAAAIDWSNLPVGIVPRGGVRLGDLAPPQTAAFDRLLQAALSQCGVALLAEIRAADGVLMPMDTRKIGWNPGNYYVAFVGAPSPSEPWILQIGGHHVAYNLGFNGARASATPLFDGVEPVDFQAGERRHEPLAAQAGAMRAVANAVSALPGARLEGEFRDVTRGATQKGDSNFPIAYPTGTSGRGVRDGALNDVQRRSVRQALARWVELPNSAVSKPLMAEYLTEAALAETYVGVAGSPDLSTPGSYVRIDGPRVWIEFIVQPAAADANKLHYHTIWRDKLADYGGAFVK
jgi:hypothetical protein